MIILLESTLNFASNSEYFVPNVNKTSERNDLVRVTGVFQVFFSQFWNTDTLTELGHSNRIELLQKHHLLNLFHLKLVAFPVRGTLHKMCILKLIFDRR